MGWYRERFKEEPLNLLLYVFEYYPMIGWKWWQHQPMYRHGDYLERKLFGTPRKNRKPRSWRKWWKW